MELGRKIKYAIYDKATKGIASMTGTLKETKFLEKGVLTPEEFVLDGDHLVNKCGTWA